MIQGLLKSKGNGCENVVDDDDPLFKKSMLGERVRVGIYVSSVRME
jgi:hypothetical protein